MKIFSFLAALLVCNVVAKAQNVLLAEYFIDTDKGYGQNTLISLVNPLPDGKYNLNINLAGATIGYHKLYIRTKDSDGKWGNTSRRNIEVIPSASKKVISNGEYFFDNDPGFGAATPFIISPQDTVILQNFTMTVTNLSVGYHKLYLRTKDSDGSWSITARRNVEIMTPFVSVIAGAEYFFKADSGFGKVNQVAFALPASDGSFFFKIPIDKIPIGANTLYIRARDSVNNNWSITQSLTDSVVTSVRDGNWSQPGTWSNNKIPGPGTVVLLYHNVVVDIDATCKSITPYRNSAKCTVLAGKLFKIIGHK